MSLRINTKPPAVRAWKFPSALRLTLKGLRWSIIHNILANMTLSHPFGKTDIFACFPPIFKGTFLTMNFIYLIEEKKRMLGYLNVSTAPRRSGTSYYCTSDTGEGIQTHCVFCGCTASPNPCLWPAFSCTNLSAIFPLTVQSCRYKVPRNLILWWLHFPKDHDINIKIWQQRNVFRLLNPIFLKTYLFFTRMAIIHDCPNKAKLVELNSGWKCVPQITICQYEGTTLK